MMKLTTMKACMLSAAALCALTVSGWAANAPVFVTAAQDSFANRVPLNAGTALNRSSILRTLSDGSAALRVGDGQVNLGHRTQLTVQNGALNLNRGYVHIEGSVAVGQAGRTLTPASAGTEYEVVALTNGVTYLHVIRGQVRIAGVTRPVTVIAGHAVEMQAQGAGAAAQSGTAGSAGASGASGAAGAGSAGAAGAGAAGAGAAAGAAAATGIGISAVAVGAIAAAALATGLIVHAATSSSSPSQP